MVSLTMLHTFYAINATVEHTPITSQKAREAFGRVFTMQRLNYMFGRKVVKIAKGIRSGIEQDRLTHFGLM